MADAKICDRCYKYYLESDNIIKDNSSTYMTGLKKILKYKKAKWESDYQTIELCPNCIAGFNDFMGY